MASACVRRADVVLDIPPNFLEIPFQARPCIRSGLIEPIELFFERCVQKRFIVIFSPLIGPQIQV